MDDATLAAIRERRERAHRMVADLCAGRQRWTMRVPAEPDRDSDLVITAALADIDTLLAEVDRLRALLTPERMAAALREAEEMLRDWVDFGVSTLDAAEAVLGSLRRGYPVEDGEGVPSGDGGPDVGSGVRHPPPSAPTAPPSSVGRMIIVHP